MFDLSGKLALVTGCRRGIGLAMAEALARAGADVVGTSLSLGPGESDARARVEAAGRSFVAYKADLGTPDGAARLASVLAHDERKIDILIANAGTIMRAPAVDHTDEMWATVLQTNLTSAFVLARELGRQMVARGRGKIVFTASCSASRAASTSRATRRRSRGSSGSCARCRTSGLRSA